MTTNGAAVEVRGLTKLFPIPFSRRAVQAVAAVDLNVQPGEVYGLLGPNGSGKSTILKTILGLVTPTEGTTRIFGVDSREVRSRARVGFLPENPYFYRFLTGAETLRFFGKLCRVPRADLDRQATDLLDLVGLTSAGDRRLGTYSKGMLQRIGLAQALINQPELVVLDEPTAGVDPAGSRDIRDLILDLKKRGITVLLSSHLLDQVEEVCDRVGILAKGRLLREGRIDDLLGVADQTELLLQNASPELLDQISAMSAGAGAKVIARRKARTTLEELFLAVTGSGEKNAEARMRKSEGGTKLE